MAENVDYLDSILADQTLSKDSDELKNIETTKEEVQEVLRDAFGSKPSIRNGGSIAKHTMIRESYDLDIVCYFDHDDTTAGENLQDIYETVQQVLTEDFSVQPKTSALRLQSSDLDRNDLHVDVVPGRFIDKTKSDVFL